MNKLQVAFSLWQSYLEYNLKKTKLSHGPLITGVEITNACNYACDFCPMNSRNKVTIKRLVHRKKNLMKVSDFEEIIKRYKKYMGIIDLSHHGESFVHPKFPEFIKVLKRYGVKYRITTNGSLINKYFDALIDYPPAQIYFSLYTVDKIKYGQVTGGGKVDVALKNILDFLKLRKDNGLNIEVFIRTINYPLIKDGIQKLEKYFAKYDVIIDKNVLNSWAGRVDIKKYDSDYKRHTRVDKFCIQPWQHLIICSDAGAYTCNNHEDVPIGYVLKEDIMKLWNGKRMQEIRKNILSGKLTKNDICRECDYFNFASTVDSPNPWFIFRKDFLMKSMFFFRLGKRGDLGELNLKYKK